MNSKFYRNLYLWITIIFALTSISNSQIDDIQFERISIESGLSQSSILCICQDSKNFIWFGTYEGLNRYDGYNFKVYKSEPENPHSLSHNTIESILEDHLGVLWIGTEEGLNRFDYIKEQFKKYKNVFGDEKININTADPLVLSSLHDDLTLDMAKDMAEYRLNSDEDTLTSLTWYYNEGAGVPESIKLPKETVATTSKHFKITSVGHFGNMTKRVEAILERRDEEALEQEDKEDFRTLSWKID